MQVSDGCNEDVVEKLEAQFNNIIVTEEAANPEITQKEIALALMESLGCVLLNITCPDCRRLNKKMIEAMMPRILRDAMKEAAQYPQPSEHVH
jgi:hypothetical protein